MRREQRVKVRRLSLWFLINLTIFVACYLNYRFQLKHRYLYKTLNIGLCLSRAAAMVINFNLLLVWLPMCKYSLTRLSCLGISSIRRQREQDINEKRQTNLNQIISLAPVNLNNNYSLKNESKLCFESSPSSSTCCESSKLNRLFRKFKTSIEAAFKQLNKWFRISKLNFINSFLIAVDHCKSLHTICATTITIASVIHTAAHLMNVINFSRNYDTFLSNLNMAEYKGQNPMQLLVSVPGITGSLMIIILILMSLSSVDVIRNSSYDLFQIFHRLSVIFVLLLFLHPSSHVLKEQSNVDRHHPDFCHVTATTTSNQLFMQNHSSSLPLTSQAIDSKLVPNLVLFTPEVSPDESRIAPPASADGSRNHREAEIKPPHRGQTNNKLAIAATSRESATITTATTTTNNTTTSNNVKNNTTIDLKITVRNNDNSSAIIIRESSINSHSQTQARNKRNLLNGTFNSNTDLSGRLVGTTNDNMAEKQETNMRKNLFCLDEKPLFVAQSSICWYVLSIGLSCYLFDLILRKRRRSKSTIQLLEVHLDSEGNLIELVLSSNHKRFSYWLPGQFVYLNCPQIASYEWHPFTISSMDNKSRKFTLHIKTGGDWTRKLRQKLEYCSIYNNKISAEQQREQYSMSSNVFEPDIGLKFNSNNSSRTTLSFNSNSGGNIIKFSSSYLDLDDPILPNFNCYDEKTGEPQIECTKVARIIHNASEEDRISRCLEVDFMIKNNNNGKDSAINQEQQQHQQKQKLYSICQKLDRERSSKELYTNLNLFIDGPFHSPFERLLEQQVSVCIASGVGWTAFSSVFQCITNNLNLPSNIDQKKYWWSKWHNFATDTATTDDRSIIESSSSSSSSSKIRKFPKTKLHLMVIVTSIEQLKPFYYLALNYFNKIHQECQIEVDSQVNPFKEITAFITRSSKSDETAKEFCRQENIHYLNDEDQIVHVNDIFTIKFGKPCFESYLAEFNSMYKQKISIYCCGSYQIKKTVKEICGSLNKTIKSKGEKWPFYAYHEENF